MTVCTRREFLPRNANMNKVGRAKQALEPKLGIQYHEQPYSFKSTRPVMSHYQYHLFFCTNQRENGEACCADFDARAMRDYVKKKCKDLGIHKQGGVRINLAGCLGRCELGPVIAVYPDEVWYTYVDKADLDEIIEQHLQNGKVVERLKI